MTINSEKDSIDQLEVLEKADKKALEIYESNKKQFNEIALEQYKRYQNMTDAERKELKDFYHGRRIWEVGVPNITYNKVKYLDALSILVTYNNFDYGKRMPEQDNVYNYNVETKKYMSNKELLQLLGITEEEFNEQLREQYVNFFEEDNKEYKEALLILNNEEGILANKRLNEALDKIKNTKFNLDDFKIYINSDSNIEFIVDNSLWLKTRPLNSWREGDCHTSKLIIIK